MQGMQKNLRAVKALSLGGDAFRKRRKIKRPLIEGLPTHVVFKSAKADGELSFYENRKFVHDLLKEKANKFEIEITDIVNMGNMIHLLVQFKDRKNLGKFLKSFAAQTARKLTGARRGKSFGRFWDGPAFTRVILTKEDEKDLEDYFGAGHEKKNYTYEQREENRKHFNQFLYRLRQRKAFSEEELEKLVKEKNIDIDLKM